MNEDLTYQHADVNRQTRRGAYRAQQPTAPRCRTKPPNKVRSPGGVRQRRNKHWNW